MKKKENYIKYFTDNVDKFELPTYVCQAMFNLMKLANIGRNSALTIKSKIKNDLESKGYYVPKNAVPMQEVVKYLNIDIDYLESRSKNLKGDVKLA